MLALAMVKIRSQLKKKVAAKSRSKDIAPLKLKVRYGLDGKPIRLFCGKAAKSSVERDSVLDLDRRPTVQPWEFHQRSQDLGLPWARGISGEERCKILRRKGMLN